MKQLKFMLAAATAIGIATAQADTVTPLFDTDTFDGEYTVTEKVEGVDTPVTKTFVKGLAITNVPGYVYLGSYDDGNNDSVVDEVGYPNSGNALRVNTGTTPVAREINKGSALDLTAVKSVYIDTMVQFTVTPYSDKDNIEPTIGQDKLMIYLQEGEADADGNKPLSLMAIAGFAGAEGSFEAKPYKLVGMNNVQPNKWYHLVVESYADISTQDPAGEDFVGYFPGFRVFLTDPLAEPSEPAALTYEGELGEIAFEERFPGEGLLSLALVGGGHEVGLAADDVTLTYVGFAGEGVVDNLAVSTITAATSVDFTFVLGANVSAVSWTVDGKEQNSLTYSAVVGSTYDVVIKSVTYAPGYAGSKEWAGWTSNVTASATVTIDGAEEFATVTKDDKGNVTAVIPNDDTVASVTTGSFAVPEDGNAAAKAELGKVLTWATSVGRKSYSQAIAAVQKMNFDEDGNPAVFGEDDDVADEEAFLLNCAPAELAAAKEAFSFPSFTTDMTPVQMKAAIEADKSYNGAVVIEGATTLSDETGKPDWATDHDKPAFYRARLIFE